MIMAAAAGMVVRMVVRMVMMMVVAVMRVIMIMIMIVIVMRVHVVGAAFRLERRVDRRDLGAERLQQLLGRRRAQRAHAVRQELHGDVAIAEMPGNARQCRDVGSPRLEQRLGLGDYLDKAAVVEGDDIVVPQPILEIDVNRLALDAGDAERAGGALSMIQQHAVGGGQTARGMSGDDAGGARHDECDPEMTS